MREQRPRRRVDVLALLDALGIVGRRSGDQLVAPCPSHDGQKPSWKIRVAGDRAGLHHCFSCGFEGGPAALVVAVRKIELSAARSFLQAFSTRPAIGPPPTIAQYERKIPEEKRLLYPKGTVALWRSPPEELRPAIDYLLGRGLLSEEIERYAIGAVPEEIRGYGGRVIVPVVVNGVMVDFVARLFVERRLASKALSGRKDAGARKEYALWGYDELDPALEVAHVVEGIWGRIALLRAGIRNVVAACGSAWSAERTELLAPWPRIVLVPDGDAAGAKLVERAGSLRFDHELAVAQLPDGKQPDDLSLEERRDVVRRARRVQLRATEKVEIKSWAGKL